MRTWFITGGSGFLGINLVRYILENESDARVKVYDMAEFDYPEKEDERIEFIKGDIRDFEALKTAATGADVFCHTAAALPLYKKEEIFSTDIDGTRNCLAAFFGDNDFDLKDTKDAGSNEPVHAVRANAEEKRFVMISSTAVYGIPDHHPLLEDDKLIGVGPYGEAKIAAEKVCEEFRARGDLVSIIRPKSFIGPERLGVFALFYDWAKDGRGFPMIGSGKNRYQLLDVYDLCAAIHLCASKDIESVNDTFNIGAEDYTTMKEDYQAVLDCAGFGKKIKGFPATPLILALRFLELLHLSPLYKWVYETASKDSFVSIDKAKSKLGFSPKYSNKDALVRNYKWYLKHLSEFEGKGGVSHRVPWKQGALGIAKRFF
jgi:nucleoside-diphosphate-sugar epimerase